MGRVRRLGLARFTAAVRAELPRWGATRPCLRIVRAVFAALADPAGVWAQRPGALERAHLVLADWRDTRRRLTETETRMVAVLDELDLTELATSIAGLTAVGAAAILTETGDPTRFGSPRAGQARRALPTGQRQRPTPLQDQHLRPGPTPGRGWPPGGRSGPPCRTTRYCGLIPAFDHREHNRLARQQARAAGAAALLRWLHVVVTQHVEWNPAIAAGNRTLEPAA